MYPYKDFWVEGGSEVRKPAQLKTGKTGQT